MKEIRKEALKKLRIDLMKDVGSVKGFEFYHENEDILIYLTGIMQELTEEKYELYLKLQKSSNKT